MVDDGTKADALALFARGKSARTIALELGISRNTVRTIIAGAADLKTDPPGAKTDPPRSVDPSAPASELIAFAMSKIRTLAESDIDHATRVRLLTDLASAGATLQSVLAREAATPPDMRSLEWHRWLIGVATYRTALAINMWIASLPDSDLRCALCTRDIQIPFVEAWINRSPGPEPGENAEQLTPLRECRELLVSALLEVCDAVSTNTTIAARMLRCARTLASAIARADADIKRFGEGAYEAYATGHASGPKFPTHLPRGDLPDLRSISAAELATARSAELGICCSYCDRAAAMRAAGAPESAATRGVPPIDQPDIREAARFTAFWEPYIPKVKELFDEA